jgi:hypothetical protein
MQRSSTVPANHPRLLAGALVAFVGLSAANVMPPLAQAALYSVALMALLRPPHPLPRFEIAVLTAAAVYIVVARLGAGLEIDGSLRIVRPCFEGFVLAHVLYKWCRIRDFRSAVLVLGGVVAIQFIAALLMAASPASRIAFLESVYADESYQNSQFAGALLFRGYGVSRHHLYGMPLALGLSAALLLGIASLERPGRARLLLAVGAVAALAVVTVNARIGFVPVLVCYVAGATVAFNSFYPRHALAMMLILLVPLVLLGSVWLGDDFENLATWLSAGIEQFSGVDNGDATTLSDLRSMLVFSSNTVELILGSGRACGTDEACYSDIGFVRALQEGGIVVLVLVLCLYGRMNQHIVRFFRATFGLRGASRRSAARLLAIVLHATFIAAVVKGEAFGPSDYSRLVVALAGLSMLAAAQRTRRRKVARPTLSASPYRPPVTPI